MKRILNTLILTIIFVGVGMAQNTVLPVKNIIILIPDGTSASVYSAARWYKHYNNMGKRLHVDPYICGTVTTFSSDAPIGDSAPTTSTYVNGNLAQAGNVSIYPETSENDIFSVDATRSLQPAVTLLEAMKIVQKKSTGVVATSEFCHATPADPSAHHYNRSNYTALAPQMAYQNLNVVFASGTNIVTDDMKTHFKNSGTTYIENDKNAMLHYSGNRVWALFEEYGLPYHIDRDTAKIPSIAEMTHKAIELLNKNENGFFLLVEGSKVDWAAHANDAVGMITEFIAFDEAVGVAMDFAKEDRETLVLVVSDHGNSGFSIGSRNCPGYTKLSLEELFGAVSKFKRTSEGLEQILLKTDSENIKSVFNEYTGIEITDKELDSLLQAKNNKESNYMNVSNSFTMRHTIIDIMNARTCFGYTSGGHTGEEVLLAAFHPNGDLPIGNRFNFELHDYLYKASGLQTPLEELTDKLFAKHSDVFSGYSYTIDKTNKEVPTLVVKKGRKTLRIKAFSSVAELNGEPVQIGSVVVYIDKNDTFYLPRKLVDKF